MNYRFPPTSGVPPPAAVRTSSVSLPKNDVRSELLYFIQNKCHTLSVDNIASICSDFYTCAEIEAARLLIADCSNKRLTKHKGGSDRERRERSAVDIVKICVDPNVSLPVFYSTNMARIPPVGVEHIDVSALVQEVAALRAEVRSFAAARAEVADIRATLSAVHAASATASPVNSVIKTSTNLLHTSDAQIKTTAAAGSEPTNHVAAAATMSSVPSFSAIASQLQTTGIKERPRENRRATVPVVGKSTNLQLKSVVTKRTVDIFVTRLEPETNIDEVSTYVSDVLLHDYPDASVKCVKLSSKHVDLYSSFYVSVCADARHMKDLINILMNADSWPGGVLVRRYFKPKNGDSK